MITVKSGRRGLARRQPYQAARVSDEIKHRYVCPKCGGAHHASECGVTSVTGLTAAQLRQLRGEVVEEVVLAVRRQADRGVLENFLAVLDGVDARLVRLDATVTDRQRIAGA